MCLWARLSTCIASMQQLRMINWKGHGASFFVSWIGAGMEPDVTMIESRAVTHLYMCLCLSEKLLQFSVLCEMTTRHALILSVALMLTPCSIPALVIGSIAKSWVLSWGKMLSPDNICSSLKHRIKNQHVSRVATNVTWTDLVKSSLKYRIKNQQVWSVASVRAVLVTSSPWNLSDFIPNQRCGFLRPPTF